MIGGGWVECGVLPRLARRRTESLDGRSDRIARESTEMWRMLKLTSPRLCGNGSGSIGNERDRSTENLELTGRGSKDTYLAIRASCRSASALLLLWIISIEHHNDSKRPIHFLSGVVLLDCLNIHTMCTWIEAFRSRTVGMRGVRAEHDIDVGVSIL